MKSATRVVMIGLLFWSAACGAEERIVGGGEGCEAVFQGRPERLAAETQIAPAREPGQRMLLEGIVRDASGAPVPGVVVYAYHTDDRGEYPPDERFPRGSWARRHGRLRAWAQTDASGRYAFDTIRPAGYPGTNTPAHVHLHVIEPGRCTYYIDDVVFDDDPRLTARQRAGHAHGRGGSGLTKPTRDPDGRWRVQRDIVLGAQVPGYPPR